MWQLNTWTPLGVATATITQDASFMRASGLRAQLTPELDCREASFDAKGAGLGVGPLHSIQFMYDGEPIFYGEVRVGGNTRGILGSNYILRSLALRLKEVALSPSFRAPQQSAHLTVRAIIQDIIASGQLGNPALIIYDASLCPDLGFDLGPVIDASQQNPYALLERVAQAGAAMNRRVQFGVRPDRRFFCMLAKTDAVTVAPADLIGATWTEPVAETPVTAVRWFAGPFSQFGSGGVRWLTHLTRAPESAVYGDRIKSLFVDLPIRELLVSLPSPQITGRAYTGGNGGGGALDLVWESLDANEIAPLADGVGYDKYPWAFVVTTPTAGSPQPPNAGKINSGIDVIADSGDKSQVIVELFLPAAAALYLVCKRGYQPDWQAGQRANSLTIAVKSGHTSFADLLASGEADYHSVLELRGPEPYSEQVFNDVIGLPSGPSSVYLLADGEMTTLTIGEARPLVVDASKLDPLARWHFRLPAIEPADIELPYRPPEQLTGRIHVPAATPYQATVEAWEYRLSAARGMTVACLAGQAPDPAKLAQSQLIRQLDDQSVITAVSARKV